MGESSYLCFAIASLGAPFFASWSCSTCQASTLYTDGSAYKTGSVEDFLKGKEAIIATGAIVGTNDDDHYTATRVHLASTKLTPYLTELMTTMYARRRSTAFFFKLDSV